MSNLSKIVIALAILAGIMPFSGFPAVFKDWFVLLAALVIAVLMYLKEKHMVYTHMRKKEKQADTFSENGHEQDREVSESEQ